MTSTFITIVIISVIVILFANGESISDYIKIKNNVEIDHIESWIFRAFSVGIPLLLMNDKNLFFGIILLIGMGFLFSLCFRTFLNLRREKPITYLSTSNYYDEFFIKVFKGKSGYVVIFTEILIFIISMIIYTI